MREEEEVSPDGSMLDDGSDGKAEELPDSESNLQRLVV